MPLYEYECTSCEHRVEVIQRFSDEPLTECSECGAEIKKLLSAPAVQFKGTGWYVTDYGGRKSSESSSSQEEKAAKSESGGDGKASNGKAVSDGAASTAKAASKGSDD